MILYGLILVLFSCELATSVTVKTRHGELSGTVYKTVGGREVMAFLGVPFARPPVGHLRFKEPKPVEKWKGVRPARNFGPKCIQLLYYQESDPVVGEEDCLYLNVFTPNISAKLDVIVYIHGGAFMFGSGDMFNPDYILDRTDLVFVSINYRLGPFGFMTTEDNVIPGNIGMKDQVSALWWVRRNIGNFGGNASSITLAGLSAGGASVHLHYLSPLSRHLFKQGISMSGTAFCPWVIAENSKRKAHQLANSVGCHDQDSQKLLDCLQKKSAEDILLQMEELFMPWFFNPFSPFGVVVEKDSDKSFLTKNPWDIVSDKDTKDAPWLASFTTEEGLYPGGTFAIDEKKLKELDEEWETIAPFLLDYNNTVPSYMKKAISKAIRYNYFQDRPISLDVSGTLIRLIGDRLFVVDIERAARLQNQAMFSRVYLYSFGYRGKYSFTNLFCKCDDNLGASHGDDLFYVVKCDFSMNPTETQEDREMIDVMVEIWTSFVKTGKPSLPLNETWHSITENLQRFGDLNYVKISSPSDIIQTSGTNLGENEFWDEIPFKELWNIDRKYRFEDEL